MRVPVLLAACGLVVAAACTAPTEGPDDADGRLAATLPTVAPAPLAWPGETWDLVERGSWDDLDAAAAATASTCVAVVQDGELVHRWTAPGASERTSGKVWSVTKSVTALLVVAAVDDGLLALEDRVSEHVPAWAGGPSADVTVAQLLANTSGRRWTYDLDYGQMVRRAADKTAFALGVGQQHEPGTHWEYNNSAVQVLEAVLTSATGDDVAAYAQDRLLGPLGLRDTRWEHDPTGSTTTYSGITASCDDLARLGLLVARDGRWEDEQLLPAELVRQVTGESSSDLNAAYGGLWWVNHEGRVQTIERAAGFGADRAPRQGRLVPDVPADARWALGYGNQVLAVVPSQDLVAVRIGARPGSADAMGLGQVTTLALAGLD